MNKIFIAANLKSYETLSEAKDWLEKFLKIKQFEQNLSNKEVIICPPFQLLFMFNSYILSNGLPAKIGAQNLSPFDEGAYTGEVNAKQIKDFASYVIVGHSERRKYFNELEDMLKNKVSIALGNGLSPIFCVQDKDTVIPEGVNLVAYEPVFAIGSGTPDNPENADAVAGAIKSKRSDYKVFYGGSVTSDNVKTFTSKTSIDGVLVGSASLDAEEFINIINNA